MRLTDIVSNGSGDDHLKKLYEDTEAAGEIGPLPKGEYIAHIVSGELERSRTSGTPGYKLTFRVIEGNCTGRRFWLDCWLTPAALPQTKRDLTKLGIVKLEQLESPLPRFIRCKCKLALRQDDDGTERNRVTSFEVIRIDKPEDDPFAPGAGLTPPTDLPPTLPPAVATLPSQPQNAEEAEDDIPF